MPPRLKRRSEAISRDQQSSDESEEEPQRAQTQRRQRQRSSSHDESDASSTRASPSTQAHSSENILIKKLVRLALATEYSRTPLRRSDISTKIFKDANTTGRSKISFQKVFDGAQKVLRDTFGMQLIELPSKEKTSLKDRRTQATQTKVTTNTTSSKSWILTSTLPPELKTNPTLSQPSHAPNVEIEANYTALYTFILSLIYLNSNSLTDQKLDRYLKRVNADTYTPLGNKEKLLQRMMREGYVDKRRDTSSGEEVIEWVPGPRGMVEVGVQGVTGLVKTVYGYGAVELSRGAPAQANQRRQRNAESDDEDDDGAEATGRLVKIEEDELNAKLSRSLGIRVAKDGDVDKAGDEEGEDDEREGEQEQVDDQPGPSRRGGQRGRPSNASKSQSQVQTRGPRGGGGARRVNARLDDDDSSE